MFVLDLLEAEEDRGAGEHHADTRVALVEYAAEIFLETEQDVGGVASQGVDIIIVLLGEGLLLELRP